MPHSIQLPRPEAVNDNRPGSLAPSHGSALWRLAWQALAAALMARGLGDGTDLVQPCDGEVWQLMDSRPEADGCISCGFRHRFHPAIRDRVFLRVTIRPPPALA